MVLPLPMKKLLQRWWWIEDDDTDSYEGRTTWRSHSPIEHQCQDERFVISWLQTPTYCRQLCQSSKHDAVVLSTWVWPAVCFNVYTQVTNWWNRVNQIRYDTMYIFADLNDALHQGSSILLVLSCNWFDSIQDATSSKQFDRRDCSALTSRGGHDVNTWVSSDYLVDEFFTQLH